MTEPVGHWLSMPKNKNQVGNRRRCGVRRTVVPGLWGFDIRFHRVFLFAAISRLNVTDEKSRGQNFGLNRFLESEGFFGGTLKPIVFIEV